MKTEKTILMDDKGVSEIIGVILVFGILILFLGILQSISVPQWNREIEAAHFNTIYDDTLYLRQVIQETVIFNLSRTTLVHTSLDYPNRMFLNNPPKPEATISTFNDTKIKIEINDILNKTLDSCTIQIKENYNFFSTTEIVIEHGMIIGKVGEDNYIIDDPLMNKEQINLYLVECSNNSIGTKSSMNLHLFPVSDKLVNNVSSISFQTDYPDNWKNYLNSIGVDMDLSVIEPDVIKMKYNNATIRILTTSIKI